MAARYTTKQLIAMVRGVAARYGIDGGIGVNQLLKESGDGRGNFDPNVVYGPRKSSAGAMGIAQFMPATAERFGLSNPWDPVAALEAWGKYMRLLLGMFDGRYDLALAGYNWGENRATLRTAATTGKSVLTYSIPAETREYVSKILGGTSLPANVAISLPAASTPTALEPLPAIDSLASLGAPPGIPSPAVTASASLGPLLALTVGIVALAVLID